MVHKLKVESRSLGLNAQGKWRR